MAEVFYSCFHQRSGVDFARPWIWVIPMRHYTAWCKQRLGKCLHIEACSLLLFLEQSPCEAAEANLLDTGDMWPVTPVELLLGQICMWHCQGPPGLRKSFSWLHHASKPGQIQQKNFPAEPSPTGGIMSKMEMFCLFQARFWDGLHQWITQAIAYMKGN